ncbi:hypothetical protein [Levilactobacillus brevis]|uniref:hypothetical protein n=1 Tax=Levilactobacillus brevis TaxID=1580 RepID=UPI0005838309|nr:hypothetical protein [Levilactobacillus brevis]KID41894.1 hypothetical protein LbDm2_2612 [Levilactobacillus brevis]MCU0200054.1 hypothetical protein [Levilactobacillus brevis]QCZ43903.1 hypothetical protein UCCLBBS124_1579 [Levilactobacillus brevis]
MKDHATDSVTLAVSISDRRHRADVKFIRAVSFKRAWEPIEGLLAKHRRIFGLELKSSIRFKENGALS